MIAERQHLFAYDLAGFMALAGDQQYVPASQFRDGSSNSFTPIADLDGSRRSSQDGSADRRGLFTARIVVGDDHTIRLLGGNRSHHLPFAGIAIAAATEDHDQAPCDVWAQRFERLGERVGLVGLIDEDRGAVGLADPFEPALRSLQVR